MIKAPSFLSCLFGSERGDFEIMGGFAFLSCLFGSERCITDRLGMQTFLSCLFGSELIHQLLIAL